MANRQDLEQMFSISENTVIRTLKACGLDFTKGDYSEEEIANHFRPAREMIDSGKKYKDVMERFGVNEGEEEIPPQPSTNNFSNPSDAVAVATAEMAADLVQGAVKQISPFIPQLVAHSLAQEMRSPEMKKAFDQTRSQILDENQNSTAGADFLLQKMSSSSMMLEGSNQNLAQLPETSQDQG